MPQYIIALDQGTTSSRALLFDEELNVIQTAQQEIKQIYPSPGAVEHDSVEIFKSLVECVLQVVAEAKISAAEIAGIGITNQRETTVLWDRKTGQPIHNAIVWQSRVSEGVCKRLRAAGLNELFQQKTGLVLDPYFSGTKITWLLEQYPHLRNKAENGDILFGTIDTWLIWKMTGGKVHVTDVSNASRTLLFNIHTMSWDKELCKALNVPMAMLPQVKSSSEIYGEFKFIKLWDSYVPIAGIAGDQQAATFGQHCFSPGMAKNTYGTGCFLLMNTGNKPVASNNGLLTTVGWKIKDEVTYCLEGSVFIGGALVQWLRDGLGIINSSAEIEELASTVPDSGGVVIVPAFVGLGTPYWDPLARGTIQGITRGTTKAHIARAALEAIAWQSAEVLTSMQRDAGIELKSLKVDGGATNNNLLMQIQTDFLGVELARPSMQETTAKGAAALAGLGVGLWKNIAEIPLPSQGVTTFTPQMPPHTKQELFQKWTKAVARSLHWEEG
jgi:glycerol kinase